MHFEPVVKLVDEVAVTTNEEEETVEFKMYLPSKTELTYLVAPNSSGSQKSLMNGKNEAPET